MLSALARFGVTQGTYYYYYRSSELPILCLSSNDMCFKKYMTLFIIARQNY